MTLPGLAICQPCLQVGDAQRRLDLSTSVTRGGQRGSYPVLLVERFVRQ